MNGGSLLDPGGNVGMCQALTLEADSLWDNFHTYDKGIPFIHDPDGPRVAFTLSPRRKDNECPEPVAVVIKGKRYDFVIRLKDSGDGKAPTTVYIGKGSISAQDCYDA
jgi:hypothetical protein